MGVTIAVFAKPPVAGVCKTRLAHSVGSEAATELHRAMVLDTLDALEGVGADRLVVLAAPEHDGVELLRSLAPSQWEIVVQQGQGFGPRLAHGMATLTRGGDAAIITDSDSPTMPVGALARALDHLRSPKRALLGPATDGGYYLIGMSEHASAVFEGVSWSTSSVAAQTRGRLSAHGYATVELPPCPDVDVVEDLRTLRGELRNGSAGRAPRTARWLVRELPA